MELEKNYDPKTVEDRRYAEWRDSGLFTADPDAPGEPYCITIPPPNITGSLHLGHALNNTIIDTLTRWHRMRGFNAVTIPGTDHAGIATQNVVEKDIAKEGLTRHDLGREKFIERCWTWRKQYGDRIYLQFQKLGCAYDWSRARFTLDDTYVAAIHEEFIRWWDRGLIYRGARVVNWCPRCRSAISDIEVTSEDRAGKLYHFKYAFADGSGYVTIATTRPETLLGDSAVAVNPSDERYQNVIGKLLILPLTDRQIPVIADDYAKPEFGTGAVKVTPAHDLDDFECGLRHNLPQLIVIGEDGCMTEAAGERFAGLDRFEARTRVVEEMDALGLLVKLEDYTIKTPLCDRCKTVLEPLLSEQWFVNMKQLAEPAAEIVRNGTINFYPERYRRIYLEWMDNIRDWCISRQLWWGHRIPVWWTEDGRKSAGRNIEDAAERLGVDASLLRQDEDVLDTWFSSALWPHAVLGWPLETDDLKTWYPTSLLLTAQEILFLWVARMVMTGLDFVGELPFKDVYIHATVLDKNGERMSKSKGNGVDPIGEIEKYGADALRFYLLQRAGKGQDLKYREEEVKLAGQFCNKLWNASRFVMMSCPERPIGPIIPITPIVPTTPTDRWIISRLRATIDSVTSNFSTYDMDEGMRAIYHFWWDDFCDWYVEMSKPRLREDSPDRENTQKVLLNVLDATLRMIHPMIPFITEEIGQALTGNPEPMLNQKWPDASDFPSDEIAESQVAILQEAVRSLRNLRSEMKLPPGQRLKAAYRGGDGALDSEADIVMSLAKLSEFVPVDEIPADGTWVSAPIPSGEVFLEIGSALDLSKERERIAKELAAVDKDLAVVRGRLSNPQFVERAPEAIVAKEKAVLANLEENRAALLARLGSL